MMTKSLLFGLLPLLGSLLPSAAALPAGPLRGEFTIPTFANSKAASFHVDSSNLPLVTFSLQDSWAGRLGISGASSETRKLFFWYWPCSASGGCKDLAIWLNGGPGCSSLEGFLQENGPISYQPGTSAPVLNQYGWTTKTDMLYIEQPVTTGYTTGTSNITNETQLADEFYGFLQQFYTVFKELSSKNLYLTGESYAGYYIPYIANRLLTASAAEKSALPLNLKALLINDGVYSSSIVGQQIPVYRFVKANQQTLGFTNAQVANFASASQNCGYEATYNYLTYPPKGKIPLPFKGSAPSSCDQFDSYYNAAQQANSCFNIYRITDKCPTPNDPAEAYFSRSDVQTALHVPNFGQWSECSARSPFRNGDNSPYTETLFPSILKQIPITLWHGLIDSVLFSDGDRITIQNLTWGGMQGFQSAPNTPLVVDGQQKGIYHSERNLTYLEINNAGHMIPEDQPSTALHVLQYVLGQGSL